MPDEWDGNLSRNALIEKLAALKLELKGEQNRHTFTVSKWHQERKELTDELVKTRMELGGARERIHDLENS